MWTKVTAVTCWMGEVLGIVASSIYSNAMHLFNMCKYLRVLMASQTIKRIG